MSMQATSGTNAELTQKIKKGMTPEQVRAALGDPMRIDMKNGEVTWMVYGSGEQQSFIYFADGKVKSLP